MSKTTYNIPEESSNQTISITGRTLSISDGNSVELPDRDNQTLSISDHQLTISNGNSVNLPNDKQTISKQGNKVVLSGNGGEVDLPSPYDDSDVKRRLGLLESKPDKDGQTLSLNSDTRVLSISGGNNVTIPNDKQTISKQGNKLVLSNGGGEVDLPQPNNSVTYDDTNLRNRVTALETKPDNDTVYNDADVKRRLTALEGKTDNFVTGVTASREGNKVRLTYNFVTGQPKTVEFDDKDTVGVAYDDTALRNRIVTLEGRQDKDTTYRVTKGKINNNVTYKTNLFNSDDVKAGDIVHDVDTTGTTPKDVFYKVTSVSGNTINLEKLGEKNIPVGTPYNDTVLSNRVQALENKTDRDNQTLTVSGNNISISGGNTVALPTPTSYNDSDIKRRLGILESKRDNDNQTLSVSGNNLTISGGNTVSIPQPDLRGYVSISAYNEVKDALVKLLQDLNNSGAWEQTGDNILAGRLKYNRHLATGNINLFGGQPDGNSFIRTNHGSTENDLAGGI